MAGASLAEHAVPFEENFEWGKEYETCLWLGESVPIFITVPKFFSLLPGDLSEDNFDPDDFLLSHDDLKFTDEEVWMILWKI
jgi:hypothetical protein